MVIRAAMDRYCWMIMPASKVRRLPPPNNNSAKGFEVIDGIKGSHTIGVASCRTFRGRIYNDSNIDPSFANSLQNRFPFSGHDSVASPLDLQTQSSFGNSYYKNLLSNKGLFHSDLELFNARVADDFFKVAREKYNCYVLP
ncbi:Plant peroxidase [Corchorus olitorius]|uniref:peroxidase n=1 Tax=Corchorus olitorius TaxID=93759 RepID=A0A1R3FWP9_9ROSI|nr:Plant peroxidase [Corchorus olitorius]